MASKDSYINLADVIRQKTLESVPPPVEQNVIDVSLMMDMPSNVHLTAYMFRSETNSKDLIKVHGYISDGAGATITPEVGFGAHYNAELAAMDADTGGNINSFIITLNIDNGETAGSIIIPAGLTKFDISYYRTKDGGYNPSYYIGTDNVMYPFELDNTPFNNFCNNATTMVINGKAVPKTNFKEIYFGSSYKTITQEPFYFLLRCNNLYSIDISGLSNITSIGEYFIYDCNNLYSVNLGSLSKVTTIKTYFLGKSTLLQSVNLSSLSNVTTIDSPFLAYIPNLTSIQIGGVDWTTKKVNTSWLMQDVPNTTACTLYADNATLAANFKTKMNGKISNWTVVINN
jgi:hypothetical protein